MLLRVRRISLVSLNGVIHSAKIIVKGIIKLIKTIKNNINCSMGSNFFKSNNFILDKFDGRWLIL